jgi:hypothetical protein
MPVQQVFLQIPVTGGHFEWFDGQPLGRANIVFLAQQIKLCEVIRMTNITAD